MTDPLRSALESVGLLPVAQRLNTSRKHVRKRFERRWAFRHGAPAETILQPLDPELWREAGQWSDQFRAVARPPILEELRRRHLAGGGDIQILYFLTRLLRPQTVVETGVAAGWSSAAILTALQTNGTGHLWSSDLSYRSMGADVDLEPGLLVDESLRDRWTLREGGDRDNLPDILAECGPVGLFHYDSDKSAAGRRFAFQAVLPRLARRSAVVVDDISDNGHFRRWSRRQGPPWRVVIGAKGPVGLALNGQATPTP